MDLNQIVLNGNNQAWLTWQEDVEVLIEHVPPSRDREIQKKVMRPQWRGHQKMEDEIDPIALRNYYCENVIKGIRGLTKDGEPFTPGADDFKRLWDGNRDFQKFVVESAFKIENFIAEKKS